MKKIIPLFLILFFACSNAIDDESLVQLYVELNVAREKFIVSDSLYNIKKEKLFTSYKISEESFKNQIAQIKYDDKRWDKFFNSALAYVDSLQKRDTVQIK